MFTGFSSQLCRPNTNVGLLSRFIRLSAPMFNNIIVLGCIMCLSTIYLFGIRRVNDANRTMPRICKVRSNVSFVRLSPSQSQPPPRPAYHGHLTRGLLRSVGILTQRRHARSGIWRSCQNACQRRKQKDFVILSAFSMCNAFTGHCTYIHCFVGAFERFWKSPLNEGFLEWTVFWNEQTTIR